MPSVAQKLHYCAQQKLTLYKKIDNKLGGGGVVWGFFIYMSTFLVHQLEISLQHLTTATVVLLSLCLLSGHTRLNE